MIDLKTTDPAMRFRKGWQPMKDIKIVNKEPETKEPKVLSAVEAKKIEALKKAALYAKSYLGMAAQANNQKAINHWSSKLEEIQEKLQEMYNN